MSKEYHLYSTYLVLFKHVVLDGKYSAIGQIQIGLKNIGNSLLLPFYQTAMEMQGSDKEPYSCPYKTGTNYLP